MSQTQQKTIGNLGETLSCQYLQRHGYRILDKNVFNRKGYRTGEIDIIAEKDNTVVFVEVKTRVSETVLPEDAVSWRKLARMEKMAETFLARKSSQQKEYSEYRFDILAINLSKKTRMARIKHIQSVFL